MTGGGAGHYVKAQTALKNKKLNWRKTIFNMAHGIIMACHILYGGL